MRSLIILILISQVLLLFGCGGGSAGKKEVTEKSWHESLPTEVKNKIIFFADNEEGNMYDWDRGGIDSGSGVYITDEPNASASADTKYAHSGNYSAKTAIKNAYRAENSVKAVRLMVWTDKPWEEGGDNFPDTAYYSTWMYFPHVYNPNKYTPWDPGDGGWWNVFQFKSNDSDGVSQPLWVLNIAHSDTNKEMYFYLYSNYNTPSSHVASPYTPIPVGEWIHVEAKYVQSADNNGEITVWQNGEEIFSLSGVKTILSDNAVWGIGNYTDHISREGAEGEAEIYFDDSCVSEVPLNQYSD